MATTCKHRYSSVDHLAVNAICPGCVLCDVSHVPPFPVVRSQKQKKTSQFNKSNGLWLHCAASMITMALPSCQHKKQHLHPIPASRDRGGPCDPPKLASHRPFLPGKCRKPSLYSLTHPSNAPLRNRCVQQAASLPLHLAGLHEMTRRKGQLVVNSTLSALQCCLFLFVWGTLEGPRRGGKGSGC